jgi:hypothetical protein
MTGRVLGAATAQGSSKFITLNYVPALVTQKFFTADIPLLVTDITVVPRVVGSSGSAVTLAFFKAPSGVAVGSGTALTTGSADLKGTVDTNQSLTLVSDQNALTLQVGDSLGYALTGTATAAIGCVTVTLEPLS